MRKGEAMGIRILMLVISGIILSACGSRNNVIDGFKGKSDSSFIECYPITLNESYAQTYGGTFCRPTSAKMAGVDCFIGYNQFLHCIDVINLTEQKVMEQISLEVQGPNGIPDVYGISYYDDTFIIKSSCGFFRINKDGTILSKWSLSDFLKNEGKGYVTIIPGSKIIAMNVYSFMFFDKSKGTVALPIYKNEKTDIDSFIKKILLLSCTDWSVVDMIDVSYPKYLQEIEEPGILETINVLPYGDSVIYNFPASSEIFLYNRIDKTTHTFNVHSSFTQPLYTGGYASGFYHPIYYDDYRKTFWRVQERPNANGRGVTGKACTVVQISSEFRLIDEFLIQEEKHHGHISPVPIFTENYVLFPYNGGEYVTENNMAFFGLNF